MQTITIKDKTINYERLNNCVYGNPRYLFHYTEFSYDYNEALQMVRKIGGVKYRGKNFKGFVVSSYNLANDLNQIIN